MRRPAIIAMRIVTMTADIHTRLSVNPHANTVGEVPDEMVIGQTTLRK